MRIKAVEKKSGIGIASGNCINEVLEQVLLRRVAPDNLAFVVGEADILLYQFAREWTSRYDWLTQYFMRIGSQEYFVEAAKSRLKLWKTIAESRIVEDECTVAPSLATIIGRGLADDVDKLIRMDKAADCKVFGPDIKRSWAEARPKAAAFSRRHTGRNYVLAIHEDLGAIVVAPDYKIPDSPGFKIKNYFQAGRTL
jgi:hypothetical protein